MAFTEESIDWLAANTSASERGEVFDAITGLFTSPEGKHRLSNRATTNLVGFNTVEACQRVYRIIYRARASEGVGLIEIITVGVRRDDEVYAEANDLVQSGKLTSAEQTQIWDVLTFLAESRERLGLEEWDYFDDPAPTGMVKAAVAGGILSEEVARLLTQRELTAAMTAAWASGELDTNAALEAAVRLVASSATPERVLQSRRANRCGAHMPLAKAPCIRAAGHAGAHRARR